MLLFVGLGNPGAKYARNRHNIGFAVVDEIARRHGFAPWRRRFQGETSEGTLDGARLILLKPTTYMNESGRSVQEAANFFKGQALLGQRRVALEAFGTIANVVDQNLSNEPSGKRMSVFGSTPLLELLNVTLTTIRGRQRPLDLAPIIGCCPLRRERQMPIARRVATA